MVVDLGFSLNVTAFGLKPSGLGFDGFFCLLVDLRLIFPFTFYLAKSLW